MELSKLISKLNHDINILKFKLDTAIENNDENIKQLNDKLFEKSREKHDLINSHYIKPTVPNHGCYLLFIEIAHSNKKLHDYYKNLENKPYDGDAGVDLIIPSDLTLEERTNFVSHGIKCQMINHHGDLVSYELRCRSSISKSVLRLANSVGTIDSGYTGEIIAAFDNIDYVHHGRKISEALEKIGHKIELNDKVILKEGQRYVQLCAPGNAPIKVKVVDALPQLTKRGANGFGSTGN